MHLRAATSPRAPPSTSLPSARALPCATPSSQARCAVLSPADACSVLQPPARGSCQPSLQELAPLSARALIVQAVCGVTCCSAGCRCREETAPTCAVLTDGSGHTPHDLVDGHVPLAALLDPEAPLEAALEAAQRQLMSAVCPACALVYHGSDRNNTTLWCMRVGQPDPHSPTHCEPAPGSRTLVSPMGPPAACTLAHALPMPNYTLNP